MVHCTRFFNRLYAEYQQLCHVKKLQIEASNSHFDDAMLKQVTCACVSVSVSVSVCLSIHIRTHMHVFACMVMCTYVLNIALCIR